MNTFYKLKTDGAKVDSKAIRIAQDIVINAYNHAEAIQALLDNEITRAAFEPIPEDVWCSFNPIERVVEAIDGIVNRDYYADSTPWETVSDYFYYYAFGHLCGNKGGMFRAVEVATKAAEGYHHKQDLQVSPVEQTFDMYAEDGARIEVGGGGKSLPHMASLNEAPKYFDSIWYYAISANDIYTRVAENVEYGMESARGMEEFYNTVLLPRMVKIPATEMPAWIESAEAAYKLITGRAKSLCRIVNAKTVERGTGRIHQTRALEDYCLIRGENAASLDALHVAGMMYAE